MPKVLVLGHEPMVDKKLQAVMGSVASDFFGKLQWKRFPEKGSQLAKVLGDPCIVDFDTLLPDQVGRLLEVIHDPKSSPKSIWIYSRRDGSMKLLTSRCNGPLLRLNAV